MADVNFLPASGNAKSGSLATVSQILRNGHPVVNFVNGVADPFWLHSGFAPSGLLTLSAQIVAEFAFSAAVAGDARIDISFERCGTASDIDVDNFTTTKTVILAAPAAQGGMVRATANFSNAEMGGLVAGERFRVRIMRVFSDTVQDTALGDMQYLGSRVEFTGV